MKPIATFALAMAMATSAFACGKTPKPHNHARFADKHEDKAEKRDLKAYCRNHTKAECKQAKRNFKAEEKAEKPPKK